MGGTVRTVAMTGGRGDIPIPAGAHVVVDPHARILKRSSAIEAMRAYQSSLRAGGQ